MTHRAIGLLALTALFAISGCSTMKPPLQPVAHVDLPRYMGDWYVIANIPYFAEKGCVDSIESYAARPDGDIDKTYGEAYRAYQRCTSALVPWPVRKH